MKKRECALLGTTFACVIVILSILLCITKQSNMTIDEQNVIIQQKEDTILDLQNTIHMLEDEINEVYNQVDELKSNN